VNTGQARLLLADYGPWWQIERHLLDAGQIAYDGALIELVERFVQEDEGGKAHMILRIRRARETSYFRKDGWWTRHGTRWFGDFYQVEPVTRETTAYERTTPAA
jgi:hypothetical protein